MSNDIKQQIRDCNTLQEVFYVIEDNYNTNEPFGIITGAVVKQQIPKIIDLLNLKPNETNNGE